MVTERGEINDKVTPNLIFIVTSHSIFDYFFLRVRTLAVLDLVATDGDFITLDGDSSDESSPTSFLLRDELLRSGVDATAAAAEGLFFSAGVDAAAAGVLGLRLLPLEGVFSARWTVLDTSRVTTEGVIQEIKL